jgi:hypothetical protein
MCNLYSITTSQDAIHRLFKALNSDVGNLPRSALEKLAIGTSRAFPSKSRYIHPVDRSQSTSTDWVIRFSLLWSCALSWSTRFVPAIPLPDGGELETLDDARSYILGLPEEAQRLKAWQNATEALLLIGQHGGPEMLPRIGMMQALYPSQPIEPPEPAVSAPRRIGSSAASPIKREAPRKIHDFTRSPQIPTA